MQILKMCLHLRIACFCGSRQIFIMGDVEDDEVDGSVIGHVNPASTTHITLQLPPMIPGFGCAVAWNLLIVGGVMLMHKHRGRVLFCVRQPDFS